MVPDRPAWIEVDLRAIGRNVRLLCSLLEDGVALLAVVKANAYGHGAIPVARAALDAGAALLGVTCLDEALELRRAGITAGILMLGYAPPQHADLIVEHGIIANGYSNEVLTALNASAAAQGATARVHLKVDTGMGRLGPLPEQFGPLVVHALSLPNVRVEGIFTHFASADRPNDQQTTAQLAHFHAVLRVAAAHGLQPRYTHAANSAATLTRPDSHFNLVRVGAALYGLQPGPDVCLPAGISPALTFKALVAQVKRLPAGSAVSYGATYITDSPRTVAVLQVGYADGFRRSPENWRHVLVHGRRAPVLGVVCMDMCIVDVTGIPGVCAGDEAVLLGRQGDDVMTFEEVAERAGTINYEVACQLASRLPRTYLPDSARHADPAPRRLVGISRDGSSVQPR